MYASNSVCMYASVVQKYFIVREVGHIQQGRVVLQGSDFQSSQERVQAGVRKPLRNGKYVAV